MDSSIQFCIHCGHPLDRTEVSDGAQSEVLCAECGKTTPIPTAAKKDETQAICAHCEKLVPQVGQFCPWCGKEVRSAFTSAVNQGVLKPSPFQAKWNFSPWNTEGAGQVAPLCLKCGQKVRSDDSPREGGIGYSNPPWNASWDGRCEHCNFQFELAVENPLHLRVKRSVQIRPCNKSYQTFIDEGIFLSGIEVTIRDNQYGEPEKETTVFLAMSEVAQLMDSLQHDLKVYLEQFDWGHDWT